MKKFLYIVLALFSINTVFSQISDPLTPSIPKKPKEAGMFIGLGGNHQLGTSYVDCEDCKFENGNRFGYTFGLNMEDFVNENSIKYGFALMYENISVKASYREREAFEYEKNRFVGVNFRNTSEINTSALAIQPYLKFIGFELMFIKISPSISYIISSNLIHKKEILDESILLPNGEQVKILFPETNSNKIILEDNDYREVNSLQFGLATNIGFDFKVDNNYYLSPQFYYYYPFSKYSDYGDNFKISNWRVLIELRVKI
ncbi:MAG: hypothetical protein N3A67_00525 [Ignavibacteria bacterium]|nr:hypothetical protein [Ignavibacteria bacterium]